MKHLLHPNVVNIEISGIRKISNKVERSPDVINLTFGQPNYTTPTYIKEAAIQAINDHMSDNYTETAGVFELREAMSEYMNDLYGISYDAEEEIIVTVGASEALDLTFRTILTEGSEVIIPTPVYVGYEPLIQLCNAKTVYVNTANNHFKLTADVIAAQITEHTRAIVLPYPNNPMGSILSADEMQDIVDLLAGKEIFIITDEVYSEFNFLEKHVSIASYPELRDQTIIIQALSKSHAMTGWRISFALAPSYIVEQFYKIKSFNTICAPAVSQYAAIEALSNQYESK